MEFSSVKTQQQVYSDMFFAWLHDLFQDGKIQSEYGIIN